MKLLMTLFFVVASTALAKDAAKPMKGEDKKAPRAVASFSGYSLEEAVVHVLQHPLLVAEKAKNPSLAAMFLTEINVERGDGAFIVYLSYKPMNPQGAPCSVKAEGKSVNTVPDGAAGVNVRPQLVSLSSACALN